MNTPAINQLRKTISSHIGQVLTPEIAAEIELSVSQVARNTPETIALLNKWRRLIEPTVQASITPMEWDDVLDTPVMVMESDASVLLFTPYAAGKPITVWVAAGDLGEVLGMFKDLKRDAKQAGIRSVNFVGREGWVRAAGFVNKAVFGTKEI